MTLLMKWLVAHLRYRAGWLPPVVNWTSSYLFNAETDPDEGLNEDEVEVTLTKLMALYQQAKAGIGGGGKVGRPSMSAAA